MRGLRRVSVLLLAVATACSSSSSGEPAADTVLVDSDEPDGETTDDFTDDAPVTVADDAPVAVDDDSPPPPPETLQRPGSPEPATDPDMDPTDDVAALDAAEYLEARGGIIDFSTSVDGTTTSVTTLLTTDQGTVRRTTVATGLEHTQILTTADPSEQTVFTMSFDAAWDDTGSETYNDAAGYTRNRDGDVIGNLGVRLPPFRTVQPMEQLGSIDDPLPLTGATFDWVENNDNPGGSIYDVGDAWSVQIGGMVEPGFIETATETDGRCVLLYGTTTWLTSARIWSTVSQDYDPPEPGLVVDGEIRSSDGTFQLDGGSPLQCDVLPAFEQGYTLTGEGGSTLAHTIPFYAAWFVPTGSTIDAVAMGNWDDSSGDLLTAYFSPDIIDTIEPAVRPESPYQYFIDSRVLPSDEVTHLGGRGTWTLRFEDVVTLPITADLFGGDLADCYAIVGTATLESIDDEEEFLGFFSEPGLVASGLHREGGRTDCDTSSLEADGYETVRSATEDIAIGDTVQFFETLYVEKRLDVELITLSNLGGPLLLELP